MTTNELEAKEMAPHSSTLAWRPHGGRSLTKSQTRLSNFTFTFTFTASTLQMGRLAFQELLANLRSPDLPTSKPFSANGGRITVTNWGGEDHPPPDIGKSITMHPALLFRKMTLLQPCGEESPWHRGACPFPLSRAAS